jgi:hypothetical protein
MGVHGLNPKSPSKRRAARLQIEQPDLGAHYAKAFYVLAERLKGLSGSILIFNKLCLETFREIFSDGNLFTRYNNTLSTSSNVFQSSTLL